MSSLTQTLLLLALAATFGLIFTNALPGAWWQWTLAASMLTVAAAGSSNADEKEK